MTSTLATNGESSLPVVLSLCALSLPLLLIGLIFAKMNRFYIAFLCVVFGGVLAETALFVSYASLVQHMASVLINISDALQQIRSNSVD